MTGNKVITLSGVCKSFGSFEAVRDVNLGLRENEFFAVLGPSGCGKTTLLRIIGGFEEPTSGRVMLDGRDITNLRPNKRPINLMFQSYALFPHMTVEGNIAYGLEMEKLPKDEIRHRVAEAIEMVDLGKFTGRRPDELSGGQRQRVALARALIKRPKILLLDEPLAALDRKLREQMQLELKRLQHEVGITFVVVTHDQEEALVMADRIALMQNGEIVQVDDPRRLYEHPNSRFVADFIGSMNFFDGTIIDATIRLAGGDLLKARENAGNGPGTLAVRPERISISRKKPGGRKNMLKGRIVDIAYHGQDLNIHVEIPSIAGRRLARLSARESERENFRLGENVWYSWDYGDSRLLTT